MIDYDASSKRHIEIAKRQARADEDARRVFLNHVMGMVDGRAYIHDLLLRCHVFAQPFSPDPYITAFALGELNIGQSVLADIMLFCPDHYITMMREANARSSATDARLRRSNADADGRDIVPAYRHPGDDSPAATEYNPIDRDEG